MDIVYASLTRRDAVTPPGSSEAAEVVGALWAHAAPADGLEHASARVERDRVDLLLYLLTRTPADLAASGSVERVSALLARCHQASPRLRSLYLAPDVQTSLCPGDADPA